MAMTSSEFCEALAQHFRGIGELLADHISEYDELLPNVFLGDVTRYVLADGQDRRRIVEYLDDAFGSQGPDVENLIAVSFVENVETREELERATDGLEASRIRAEWERQRAT